MLRIHLSTEARSPFRLRFPCGSGSAHMRPGCSANDERLPSLLLLGQASRDERQSSAKAIHPPRVLHKVSLFLAHDWRARWVGMSAEYGLLGLLPADHRTV